MAGELDEVLSSAEKSGGRNEGATEAKDCKNLINKNALLDLGFQGPNFMWTNGIEGNCLIKEWLDRALANAE